MLYAVQNLENGAVHVSPFLGSLPDTREDWVRDDTLLFEEWEELEEWRYDS